MHTAASFTGPGAKRNGQRQEMLLGRMIVNGVRCEHAVAHEILDGSRLDFVVHPVRELAHPFGGRSIRCVATGIKRLEIVRGRTRTDDEEALFLQRGERTTDRYMVRGPQVRLYR